MLNRLQTNLIGQNESDWEIVHNGKAKKHSREQIVCRIVEDKAVTKLTLSIGLEIAGICNFKKGDRILFLRNKLNDLNFLIKKSDLSATYALAHAEQSNCLTFSLTYNVKKDFVLSQNRIVNFQIQPDYSILIDLNCMVK